MAEIEPQTLEDLDAEDAEQLRALQEMDTGKPRTLEEFDADILAVSHCRDRLRELSLDLHRRRDELLRGGRVDGMLDGLSDADLAALRERLAEGERA